MEIVGKTLGNYRIDRLLGEGGMGAVYQAHDLSLQRNVAIKVIHENIGRRPTLRERFMQEARVMARLDHPGIVKVFTVSTLDDMLYIVMEFIPGSNLHQLLEDLKQKNKWLPLHEAVHILEQLCDTLEYAHRHKVLHRDIKPANLMLKREPSDGLPFRVILTDLGLAKLVEGQGITQERATLGTPAYMSPEQASGQETDARSDVYSLGILLYELAVGRLPFPIRTITEAIRYHTQEQPSAPRSVRPDLPEALERVILKAMEKKPEDRYSSAEALGTVLAGVSSTSTELVNPAGGQGNSLITVYDRSMAAPPAPAKPRPAGPRTMLDDGAALSRGASVFGNKSIPPSPQTRIQVVYKNKTAEVFPLLAGTVIIGRGPNNDIPLTDPKASQRHAQITWDGMEYHVLDLDSTNGTYLGSTRLLSGFSEVWRPNQNMRIGDTWLRLIRPTLGAQNGSRIASRLGASALFKSPGAGYVGVIITPQELKIEPGGSVTGTLSLLNQSPNVDHFSIAMTGIPTSWIASLPSSVQLMPGNQTEAVFSLHVPRAPQSRAGQHQIILKVASLSDPTQFVEARLVLTIAVYSQFNTEMELQRLRVRQTGRLTIANQGNTNTTFSIKAQDPEEALDFRLTPRELAIAEGQSGVVEINASLRQPPLIGSDKLYPFTIEVTSANAEPQTQSVELIGRALFPKWALPVGLFSCILLGLLSLIPIRSGIAARQTQTAIASLTANSSLVLTATAGWLLQDDDRDGLTNDQELELDTFPGDRDTDRDGLDDGQEVNTYTTKPLLPDTDGDGLKDGDEVSRGSDPTKPDTDGDGIPDNRDQDPASTPTATSAPTATPTQIPTNTPITPPTPTQTPYFANFESGAGSEWSPAKRTQSPSGNRGFLGEFGNETVSLNLNNLPSHSSITLNLDLYIIRSWSGNTNPDVWDLKIPNGRTLLKTTFSNEQGEEQAYPELLGAGTNNLPRTGADEIDTLGFDYSGAPMDAVYNLSFTFAHSGPSIEFVFSSNGLQEITDESWGLDNVEVILK